MSVAAFIGEGEVESQRVFFTRDSAQGGQDAALLVQNHTEVPWKKEANHTDTLLPEPGADLSRFFFSVLIHLHLTFSDSS